MLQTMLKAIGWLFGLFQAKPRTFGDGPTGTYTSFSISSRPVLGEYTELDGENYLTPHMLLTGGTPSGIYTSFNLTNAPILGEYVTLGGVNYLVPHFISSSGGSGAQGYRGNQGYVGGSAGRQGYCGIQGYIGTAGVTAPGAMMLLEQHTISGAGSVALTSFTSTYDDYLVEFVNFTVSNSAVSMFMRGSTNGGVSYDNGSNYQWEYMYIGNGAGTGGHGSISDTAIQIGDSVSDSGTASYNASMRLYNPLGASLYKFAMFDAIYGVSTVTYRAAGGGEYSNTAAMNAVQFFPSAGTFSGTIRLYGVVKNTPAGTTLGLPSTTQGRLTLTSGTPVTTSDVLAATTVYFTPFRGNHISLYYNSMWGDFVFSEVNVAVPATTSTPFDLFAYWSGSAVVLETVNWTNSTTRATAIAYQDGIPVKSGDSTRKYLGTGCTTGVSGQTEDSERGTVSMTGGNRLLWNYYNRVSRNISVIDTTNNWVYSTATWRQANAGAGSGNKVQCVIGIAEELLEVVVQGLESDTVASTPAIGVGIDSTTVNSAKTFVNGSSSLNGLTLVAFYRGYPVVGLHNINWLEIGSGSGTTTWYGNAGATQVQSGMQATLNG